jgi:hypothetical protein
MIDCGISLNELLAIDPVDRDRPVEPANRPSCHRERKPEGEAKRNDVLSKTRKPSSEAEVVSGNGTVGAHERDVASWIGADHSPKGNNMPAALEGDRGSTVDDVLDGYHQPGCKQEARSDRRLVAAKSLNTQDT